MRIPADQRFYLEHEEQLVSEIRRLGVALSLDAVGGFLADGLSAGGCRISNRFCARMADGGDAEKDGAPSALTTRRCVALARGGFGLICTEPVAVDAVSRRHSRQLLLCGETAAAFAALIAAMRESASKECLPAPRVFLQIDDAAMMAAASETEGLSYALAAQAAAAAGFDGMEIRCESPAALEDIESAAASADDPSPFDVASLWITDVVHAVRTACPEMPLAVRLCVYTARGNPTGFGTDADDFRLFNPEFPVRLARRLSRLGVCLLNMTANYPAHRDIPETAAANPIPPDGFPHEHPLAALARVIAIARHLRGAVPGLAVAAGGFSWLRQWMPAVAAAAIRDGALDMVALERFALAYPDAPADWFRDLRLDPYRCCIQCGACGEMRRAGIRAGCVLQDRDTYGPLYRGLHRNDRLIEDASRCHRCVPAPCSRSTPAGLDIPGFMRAYARGDVRRAGRLLRARQVLPEMCALLSPYGASGERDCIETALSGTAVPIRDLQYSAACQTRDDEVAAVRLPLQESGWRVAVVGGGPAGIAAAATLLERGHAVTLYEQSGALGGVPERLIPATRFPGAREEIATLLAPAIREGRLEVRLNSTLGRDVTVEEVRQGGDALLLAAGLWKERSLGTGSGIYSGLEFLEMAKTGGGRNFSGRAVLLAGGDCAMDAACMLKGLGADPLTILFGGVRADMHWCMEESWFAQPGVHARMLCCPVGYRLDDAGHVTGVRFVPMEPDAGGGAHELPGSECVLAADLVVEALGLEVTDAFRAAFPQLDFTAGGLLRRPDETAFGTGVDGVFAAGALINGGASVPQCVEEGRRAAAEIHEWLGRRAKSLIPCGSPQVRPPVGISGTSR